MKVKNTRILKDSLSQSIFLMRRVTQITYALDENIYFRFLMKLSVKISLIISLLIIGIASCQSPSKKTEKASSPEDLAAGLALLVSSCYT